MATTVVFVAFAKEDERQRDLLKGQSLNTRSPFEYVDMSVKEPYSSEWKERVRTRIRRSDGVIAFDQQEHAQREWRDLGDQLCDRRDDATSRDMGVQR